MTPRIIDTLVGACARYRVGAEGSDVYLEGSTNFVSVSVFIALLIGTGFIVVGWRGRQRWLVAWGALTVLVCLGVAVGITDFIA